MRNPKGPELPPQAQAGGERFSRVSCALDARAGPRQRAAPRPREIPRRRVERGWSAGRRGKVDGQIRLNVAAKLGAGFQGTGPLAGARRVWEPWGGPPRGSQGAPEEGRPCAVRRGADKRSDARKALGRNPPRAYGLVRHFEEVADVGFAERRVVVVDEIAHGVVALGVEA